MGQSLGTEGTDDSVRPMRYKDKMGIYILYLNFGSGVPGGIGWDQALLGVEEISLGIWVMIGFQSDSFPFMSV